MKKKNFTKNMPIRMTPEDYEQLTKYAKRHGISRSAAVRRLIQKTKAGYDGN